MEIVRSFHNCTLWNVYSTFKRVIKPILLSYYICQHFEEVEGEKEIEVDEEVLVYFVIMRF